MNPRALGAISKANARRFGRAAVKPAAPAYPCSQCGGDAYIGYVASGKPGGDWGGTVKPGERLCTLCFQGRGGPRVL